MSAPPRFLYHGTNKRYHDGQVAQHGAYQHPEGDVEVTDSPEWAAEKAAQSAYAHEAFGPKDGPVILVIDSTRVGAQIVYGPYPDGFSPAEDKWSIANLETTSFRMVDVEIGVPSRTMARLEEMLAVLESD